MTTITKIIMTSSDSIIITQTLTPTPVTGLSWPRAPPVTSEQGAWLSWLVLHVQPLPSTLFPSVVAAGHGRRVSAWIPMNGSRGVTRSYANIPKFTLQILPTDNVRRGLGMHYSSYIFQLSPKFRKVYIVSRKCRNNNCFIFIYLLVGIQQRFVVSISKVKGFIQLVKSSYTTYSLAGKGQVKYVRPFEDFKQV